MTDWRSRAACAGLPADLFFPDHGAHPAEVEAAKAVCRHCDVARDCLAFALELHIDHGIFGGLSPRQREQLARALTKETAA